VTRMFFALFIELSQFERRAAFRFYRARIYQSAVFTFAQPIR
jgi:hypothetical protein